MPEIEAGDADVAVEARRMSAVVRVGWERERRRAIRAPIEMPMNRALGIESSSCNQRGVSCVQFS